jgi:copper(I)-binding protein
MNNFNMISKYLYKLLMILLLNTATLANAAEWVTIDNAWVRNSLPGQNVTAAYMTLTSQQKDVYLIRAESDITDSVEIHSMSMQNGVMKMRMLKELPLTKGKPYKLAPGGYHLMLFDLKKPLNSGEKVNFLLTFKSGKHAQKQTLTAVVQSANEANDDDHSHPQHHH